MAKAWNKGYTRHTNLSVKKISETMRSKKIDNFLSWRNQNKKELHPLHKNGDLAELIGMVLGDGSIHHYERTEGLRIVLPTTRLQLIWRYEELVEKVFAKKPSINARKSSACVNINLYQKGISERLEIPHGGRSNIEITMPIWIMKNKNFMIRYLRGLYEAEGSYCVHKETYTYKLIFSNTNQSLLETVFYGLKILGLHPHKTTNTVQLSRKDEVTRAVELIEFRKY